MGLSSSSTSVGKEVQKFLGEVGLLAFGLGPDRTGPKSTNQSLKIARAMASRVSFIRRLRSILSSRAPSIPMISSFLLFQNPSHPIPETIPKVFRVAMRSHPEPAEKPQGLRHSNASEDSKHSCVPTHFGLLPARASLRLQNWLAQLRFGLSTP